MDHETLFTASKWDILKLLEQGPASPLELSTRCKTSIANVSQQLRLLELAGLVSSRRVSNRDKGKPRVLYGLAGNLSYVIATTDRFVDKKAITLSDYNKIIMRIWFYEKQSLHYALEKAFWRIEEHLDKISCIALDTSREAPIALYIQFKGKPFDIKPFTITDPTGATHQIVCTTRAPPKGSAYTLHDPTGTLQERRKNHGE